MRYEIVINYVCVREEDAIRLARELFIKTRHKPIIKASEEIEYDVEG